MNIYNKATLTVILIITIIISFVFYYFTSDEKVDKDKLYENKIANHKKPGTKNYGVASNNAIATKIGEKVIEDGGNATDAAFAVSYALAVTEPHSSGLGGGGATLT
ncbi:gamma-glutamyltransferase, partial [Staphylococcus epidermidis]